MAIKSENQQRTGLRSLELLYEPVRDTVLDDVIAYRAVQRINHPDIGVILQSEFLPVAIRSVQSVKLSAWALEEVISAIAKLTAKGVFFEWISVHIPLRYLKTEDFFENLSKLLETSKIESRKLCFEFPADILYETPSEINPLLNKLDALCVSAFMTEFGSEFCPVMRLSEFNVTGVMIAPEVCYNLQFDEKRESVFSMIEIPKTLEKQVILCGIDTNDIVDLAADREYNFITGKSAGKQRKLSGIR